MKNLLLLLLPIMGFAQTSIVGRYATNFLITHNDVQEYILTPAPANRHIFGNSITFNDDGTFKTGYSVRCGNDCFTNSFGKYTMVDDTHVRIEVGAVTTSGYCSEKLNLGYKDLGVFYVLHEEGKLHLIKE